MQKMDKEGKEERGTETKDELEQRKNEHNNKECIRGDTKERNK